MRLTDVLRKAVLALPLLLVSQAYAQDENEITIQRLSETVWVLFDGGGNIGVSAGPDGVFIIDDQYDGAGRGNCLSLHSTTRCLCTLTAKKSTCCT